VYDYGAVDFNKDWAASELEGFLAWHFRLRKDPYYKSQKPLANF